MTLEEYFDNEIKIAETEEYKNPGDFMEFISRQLAIKLLRVIKEEVLKLDHEVTLREFVESCKKDRKNFCPECPWNEMCFLNDDWYCGGYPFCELDVDEIQKRIKETKK